MLVFYIFSPQQHLANLCITNKHTLDLVSKCYLWRPSLSNNTHTYYDVLDQQVCCFSNWSNSIWVALYFRSNLKNWLEMEWWIILASKWMLTMVKMFTSSHVQPDISALVSKSFLAKLWKIWTKMLVPCRRS